MSETLQDIQFKYIEQFCFKHENLKCTSHYLIFVSQHFKGYEIMKWIMAKESSQQNQCVPSFEYNNAATLRQPFFFELSRPMDEPMDE